MTEIFISVIIPTYNRCNSLLLALRSLDNQKIPNEDFEVIVVDDGSTDNTEQVCLNQFNFDLQYKYQSNHGDAAARNTGARMARGDFLVFLDDDIRIEPGYLEGLSSYYSTEPSTIIMGKTVNKSETAANTFQSIMSQTIDERMKSETPGFDQLCSNNMGLKKEDYFRIGGMQSLGFEGSDMWCDVDFAYRAYKNNFQFRRNLEAVCFHVDKNLETRSKFMLRSEEISTRAVALFGKYPQLQSHLSIVSLINIISSLLFNSFLDCDSSTYSYFSILLSCKQFLNL